MREEVARSATGTRQEMGGTLAQFQQTLLMQQGDHARTQNEQLEACQTPMSGVNRGEATVETRLQALQADNERKLEQMRQTVDEKNSTPRSKGPPGQKASNKVAKERLDFGTPWLG